MLGVRQAPVSPESGGAPTRTRTIAAVSRSANNPVSTRRRTWRLTNFYRTTGSAPEAGLDLPPSRYPHSRDRRKMLQQDTPHFLDGQRAPLTRMFASDDEL